MSEDEKKKPDPVEDVKKGLGLLFRAAKTAVDDFPSERIEEVVKTGAREVGRAIETVTSTIEQEVRGLRKSTRPPPAPSAAEEAPKAASPAVSSDEPKPD